MDRASVTRQDHLNSVLDALPFDFKSVGAIKAVHPTWRRSAEFHAKWGGSEGVQTPYDPHSARRCAGVKTSSSSASSAPISRPAVFREVFFSRKAPIFRLLTPRGCGDHRVKGLVFGTDAAATASASGTSSPSQYVLPVDCSSILDRSSLKFADALLRYLQVEETISPDLPIALMPSLGLHLPQRRAATGQTFLEHRAASGIKALRLSGCDALLAEDDGDDCAYDVSSCEALIPRRWQCLSGLVSLTVSRSHISSSDLAVLDFPALESLTITRCTNVTSLAALAEACLPKLREFHAINIVNADDEFSGFAGLQNFTQLELLDVQNMHFEKAAHSACHFIAKSVSRTLTTLLLAGSNVTSVGNSLHALVNLKELALQNTEVSDVSPLVKLPSLTSLDLQSCEEVADVGCLSECPCLSVLDLSASSATGLATLVQSRSIKTLDATALKHDAPFSASVPAIPVPSEPGSPPLTSLTLIGNQTLTNLDWLRCCVNLTHLNVSGGCPLSQDAYDALPQFPLLADMDVTSCTNVNFGALVRCKSLTRLAAVNMAVPPSAVEQLSKVLKLKRLNIRDATMLTVESLCELVENAPALKVVVSSYLEEKEDSPNWRRLESAAERREITVLTDSLDTEISDELFYSED